MRGRKGRRRVGRVHNKRRQAKRLKRYGNSRGGIRL